MNRINKVTRWASALMAAGAAGAIPVAHADIELGNGISITGFLDMSYSSVKPDGGSSTESIGIDQFETDFKYAGSSGVSAQVDIEYGDGFDGSDDETFVEQAFITKAFNEQFSVKVGRFLSYTGWETEEPTGLFQYSGTGYAPYFYGFYQNGVSAYYNGGKFAVMGSAVASAFNPLDRNSIDGVDDKMGYEFGVSVTPVEGLTAKAFYISDNDTDTDIVNVWVSYAVSGFTFAGEYNTADYGGINYDYDGDGVIDATGVEGDGYLLMANYATGPYGFTVRYHDFEIEDAAGATTDDGSAITLSPSYKVGGNLLLVGEYRMDSSDTRGDSDLFAIEALFTF
ncbi:outer membrane beta-barrel protein [Solimonas sp. K1W22B-7]|uniref:outer membrane beta-barrel protein n=1 Tax=Solimonas sp. K1W22B-7 TaxID=2303331 RepID=UPI001969104B|nr:outer membrane beta-barrel protein [Solimonas sp. K1W22B-7]